MGRVGCDTNGFAMTSPQTGLVRAIGRWSLAALAVNSIIGSGIFGLPATVAGLLGKRSVVAVLIAGAAMGVSKPALPCIVCGAALDNVIDDSENQPYGATAFMSDGHYGSTAFDPLDGTFLEVNICDPCLIQAQLNAEVLWGRDHRPVIAEGMVVGGERVNRPLIPWNGDGSYDEVDVATIDREEIGKPIKNVEWNSGALSIAADVKGK